ncbi:crossover junction endodeoxyribonuclease RuvC [bacterium CG_4_9_14_3_um_filter_65_15]|nr:MAG: crossover junction endodeoxyribonuclease RuvC [bacterium CG_4_9_14_3_um_filter_65_15]
MIILGVDPGSHATGYGVIETGPVARMIAGGVIRPTKGLDLSERLLAIHDGMQSVIRAHGPEIMVIEDLFNAKNARSSLVLGHARGVLVLAGAEAGLAIVSYAPREIKQALTGSGAAAKQQVRFMVMRLLGLQEEPSLDQSDALAAALAYMGRRGRAAPA